MLQRRSLFTVTVITAVLLFISACSGGGNSSSSNNNQIKPTATTDTNKKPDNNNNNEQAAKKKAKLDFVWFTDGVEGEVMKSIIDDYTATNDHITINLIEVAYKDLETKLKTMIAGGKPPALSRMTNPGAYANQALDLSAYVDNVDAFKEQFVASVEPYYYINNKLVAVPMDVTANGLIYNKTLFDKANVSVPQSPDDIWTWDEFSTALREVMDKGGAKHGMVMDFTPHRWSTQLYQFGGSIFSEDGATATINNEAGVKAVEYFVKMHKDGLMPESVWLGGENPNNLFRSGTVATHFSGNWMVNNYKDIDNFEWGVTYMPKEVQRSSVPGGKYVMAFQNSGVEDEAAAFIDYLASQEVNAKFTSESLFISPRIDNAQLNYEFGAEMFALFADELNNTPPAAALDWSKQLVIPKVQNEIRDSVVEVLTGNLTAQQALDAVAEKINTAIKEAAN